MSIRTERVAEEIRKVISELLIRGLKTPLPGFVTVNSVNISPDLKMAKIMFSVFGSDEECAKAVQVLARETTHIRHMLAQKVHLRAVPRLTFCLDETPKKAAHIYNIINNLPPSESED